MPVWEPILKTSPCIKKIDKPILTKGDIPYEAELVFNAGVAKIDGKYVMVFRNDYGTTREAFENDIAAGRSASFYVPHGSRTSFKDLIDNEFATLQRNTRVTNTDVYAKTSMAGWGTKVGEIKNVSLAGGKMPQKSTYFYPKLKTGLLINTITER